MALKNDCFALPSDQEWTPVDQALALLRERIEPVCDTVTVPLNAALGRILAEDILARTSSPPHDNAAVDGYVLAHASLTSDGEQRLSLLEGRSAAGAPFAGTVPAGAALRILTGAVIPDGTDTVVMQEDVTRTGEGISFGSGLKPGANRRKAGEDLSAGDIALPQGCILSPADIAQAASVGISELLVRKPLRVAIFSTGDELRDPDTNPEPGSIFDSNRPMLTSLAAKQGFDVIDLGRVPDTPEAVRAALLDAAARSDAIITSGGASGGDEDHIARQLQDMGAMSLWRIAMKPGRPLAMGQIDGVPVFGLPGNPVAAFVCFLIFARPALLRLGGSEWISPLCLPFQAEFSVQKKQGRSEYLRGRYLGEGKVKKYHSDGSGLISGLRWSDGLICLHHDQGPIAEGDEVDYIPYTAFGL